MEIEVCLSNDEQRMCQKISSHLFEDPLYLCILNKDRPVLDELTPNLKSDSKRY